MYTRTQATNKILQLKKRIRGVSGGTSASKTISILLWLIQYCQTYENKMVSIVSETLPHLKKGAIRDFENILREHGYFDDRLWNKTDYIYTFERPDKKTWKPSRLEFFSADQPHKVRGPRRDVLFINEANNISYETYTQLEIRTNSVIWLDWNPVSEFWWYTEVLPHHDVDFVTLTYKDNEALSPAIVQAIESRRHNKNWFKVYGEGLLGEAEGRIYREWNIIDEIPFEARLERRGLDFGYSNDPTAIIAVYYFNGGYILDEELYKKGMHNKPIADYILNLPNPQTLVIADSAEPKSIDEIKSYGVAILPARKGKDSIKHGIDFVQNQQISVTKRSINLLKEYRNYLWETDRDGKTLNVPEQGMDHAMDAIRYAFESIRPIVDDGDTFPDDELFDDDTGLYI